MPLALQQPQRKSTHGVEVCCHVLRLLVPDSHTQHGEAAAIWHLLQLLRTRTACVCVRVCVRWCLCVCVRVRVCAQASATMSAGPQKQTHLGRIHHVRDTQVLQQVVAVCCDRIAQEEPRQHGDGRLCPPITCTGGARTELG
jgi:hypothetical protein